MQVEKLVAGSYLVTHHQHRILVGFPPEIIKIFLARKLPIPTCWLLPDRKIVQGISQYSTEFPFYHFLFFSAPPARPEKLTVIGTARDLKVNQQILRSALLGPSEEEMFRWKIASENASFLRRELDYLALKDSAGKVLPVSHFLKEVELETDNFIKIDDDFWVRHTGFNRYEFQTKDANLPLLIEEESVRTFPYELAPLPQLPVAASNLKIMGGGNGFTPNRPCTGFLVEHQGIRLLVDVGPYIGQLTQHHGFSLSQIHGIYLTHIHDDHTAGLTEFIQSGNKVDLFSTPEVARAAFQKLALLYDQSEEQIAKNFNFIEVFPHQTISYYGMEMKSYYSIHSVPCLGLSLRLKTQGLPDFHLLYPSDTLKLERVEELFQKGVLSQTRYDSYLHFLKQPADLLVYDSGSGIIHADAQDLNQFQAKAFLCVHTDKIAPEAASHFNLARGGDTYPLTRSITPIPSPVSLEALEFLLELFPSTSTTWLKVLLEDALTYSFNPGQLVLKKGTAASNIFLLLSGNMELVIDASENTEKRVLTLVPGDLFNAETLRNKFDQPNAAIYARSIGLYLSFSGELFHQFLQRQKLSRALQEYYEIRAFLGNTPLVCELDLHTRSELACLAKSIFFPQNTTILSQGEESRDCYLIREGSVQVIRQEAQNQKILLGKSDIFGERALLLGKRRNATVIANSEVLCYQFDSLGIHDLCERNLELKNQLEKLIRSREEFLA